MPTDFSVEFHDAAAAEYDAAFDWYRERSPDAALKFDAEVNRALAQIAETPRRWASGVHFTRRFLLRRSLCCDLPRAGVQQHSNRGGRPHQPEARILEAAALECSHPRFGGATCKATPAVPR